MWLFAFGAIVPDPSLKKMILNRDIPLFSGMVRSGHEVFVLSEYKDSNGASLFNVQAGFVRIDGLEESALSEKSENFPF